MKSFANEKQQQQAELKNMYTRQGHQNKYRIYNDVRCTVCVKEKGKEKYMNTFFTLYTIHREIKK